jgi:uncharacterized damage-inducible protein DinB
MRIIEAMILEFRQEASQTRRTIERIPEASLDWKPHPKSMTMGGLATHLAEIPGWTSAITDADEFNIVTGEYAPTILKGRSVILNLFDENLTAAIQAMERMSDAMCSTPWTFKKDGHPVFTQPKISVVRSMILNHGVHHRGQLTVYLRLNEVAVPALYGPSADEAT